MLTNQEIFNTVADHLIRQNKRSYDPRFGCCYRTDDGLKCAVGALIPDHLYQEDLEGNTVRDLEVAKVLTSIGVAEDSSFDLLNELQGIHDNHDPSYWCKKLNDTAQKFGLKFYPFS